ncbi:hypothetical protein U1Q18_026564 [Sarracenia purpurea var. burkii]
MQAKLKLLASSWPIAATALGSIHSYGLINGPSLTDLHNIRPADVNGKKVRGDIARAIMYMAVCYGLNQSGGGLGLQLSDSPSVANREMGMLSTLLKWNEVDPPSREEKLRNERVCTMYQHNRNPFVDHPEYANLIWKQVVQGHQGFYTPPQLRISEFHYTKERSK